MSHCLKRIGSIIEVLNDFEQFISVSDLIVTIIWLKSWIQLPRKYSLGCLVMTKHILVTGATGFIGFHLCLGFCAMAIT